MPKGQAGSSKISARRLWELRNGSPLGPGQVLMRIDQAPENDDFSNLFVCNSRAEYIAIRNTIIGLIEPLIAAGLIEFHPEGDPLPFYCLTSKAEELLP